MNKDDIIVDMGDGEIAFTTNDVPVLFTEDQAIYIRSLHGRMTLRDLKGVMLNIIEGCGMPDKQEQAVKRMVTNALHMFDNDFKENIQLVTSKLKYVCPKCNEEFYNEASAAIHDITCK